MSYKYKYFIANWKMFGDFSSLRIINLINNYISKTKLKKNRIIFCVPTTLISHFSNKLKKSKIFIGAQNFLFNHTGISMVMAPYKNKEQKIIGAIGVVGPTRLNYAKIVPLVDYTSKVIGRMLI